MKFRTLALAALALAAAATPALAESMTAGTPTPCLRNIDIYNFKAPNDRTVIVENTQHSKFKLSLIGTCVGLAFENRLGFKTIGGSRLTCISRGDEVISYEAGMRGSCSITKIEPYTPAMQAADKAAKWAKDHPVSN